MPHAVAAACANRAEAELLVAILADAGVPGVVFADVERGPHGEVAREAAEVRIRPEDVERAREAIAAWHEARAEAFDPEELERQALEAGGATTTPDAPHADADADAAPDAEPPRRSRGTTCPHCRAPVAAGWLDRVRDAFASLAGRSGASGREHLCTACGHRWTPSG